MILNIIHFLLGGLLILVILFQGKAGGLAKTWGGANFYSRRGLEKMLFILTIILTVLFLISSILAVVLA